MPDLIYTQRPQGSSLNPHDTHFQWEVVASTSLQSLLPFHPIQENKINYVFAQNATASQTIALLRYKLTNHLTPTKFIVLPFHSSWHTFKSLRPIFEILKQCQSLRTIFPIHRIVVGEEHLAPNHIQNANLVDDAWELIRHENQKAGHPRLSLYKSGIRVRCNPPLRTRIKLSSWIKSTSPNDPPFIFHPNKIPRHMSRQIRGYFSHSHNW